MALYCFRILTESEVDRPHAYGYIHNARFISEPLVELQSAFKQLLRLCDLADNYGSGELRLTPWQNIVIPNIADAYLETVKKAVLKAGLDWRS